MAQSKSEPKQDQAAGKSTPSTRLRSKEYLLLLRSPLIGLGFSLALSIILTVYSNNRMVKLEEEQKHSHAQLGQARDKLATAENDLQTIHDYQSQYLQLRERGFYGMEKRLDWIEHINTIQKTRQLFPITYEISAQQPVKVDLPSVTGDLELRGSKMEWRMGLLHEIDLFDFLDDLNGEFYTLRTCTIKREKREASDSLKENAPLAQLTAECVLYWLTLGNPPSTSDSSSAMPGAAAQPQ